MIYKNSNRSRANDKYEILRYSTNREGSTCKTVFILSRNVLALFSYPTGTVRLNVFVAPAPLIDGGGRAPAKTARPITDVAG